MFNEFLSFTDRGLSAYTFENIYIWKAVFDVNWTIIDDSLCVFFKDRSGCFMYLPPLAKKVSGKIIEQSFAIMDGINKNKLISRIENVTEDNLPFYRELGYKYSETGREYLCLRRDLAELKGDKFKSKRASLNYFLKHYRFEYLPFSLEYKRKCLSLYKNWARARSVKNADRVYRGMLEDNYLCLKALLDNYSGLDFEGRIIRIGGDLKGFTFGFRLDDDTFCVSHEITDLDVKGVSQFIFQKFSSELTGYGYINIMDDSGLQNLKKVKLSYHPAKLLPVYVVSRPSLYTSSDWVK